MAEISRKHYSYGRRDGERGAIPIDPWAPPASEWNTEERRAYIAGWRVGRATARPLHARSETEESHDPA